MKAMTAFMGVYFALSALLNLYVYRWLRPAFGWRRRGILAFCAFALLMTLLPIATRFFDRRDYFLLAQLAAAFGYAWMLLVMWTVSFGLPVEIWNLLASVAAIRSARTLRVSSRAFVGAIAVVSAILTAWGAIEARNIRLNTITVETTKFPPGAQPLRLLQIGDVHFGPLVGKRHREQIVKLINSSKPDIIVCTGDIFDSPNEERLGDHAVELAFVNAPLGKFAVLGNHEFYGGLDSSLFLLKIAGFKTLRAENVKLSRDGVDLVLAGVDDPAGRGMGEPCHTDENAALPPAADRPFTILLKHRPDMSETTKGRMDLQLSGHTHWGQVFPFQLYVRLLYPVYKGMRTLPDGCSLWITPGAGTWGPPLRVLAPPEVTLFVIRPEEQK